MKSKYGTEIDVEQKADELLAALGRELGESRASYMENLLKEAEAELKAEAETAPVVPLKPKKGGKNRVRRALILAAVLVIVMGALAVTSEGLRLKLSSLFFRDVPGSTKLLDDENLVVNVAEVVVDYVPEGYELLSDDIFGDMDRSIHYSNGEEEFIISVTKTHFYVGNVDNDRMKSEMIRINDREGHLFITEFNCLVVWQMGDCTFQVTTSLKEDEAIEIARHVYVH